MATASATPQMVPPSSDRGTPGETKKRSSMTPEGELQRKERSFQEFLELIGPVYLLPFVFTDKDGTCIYCILLTMVGLMGRLLPPAVAAMLPIVILPLGDVYGADHLAAEYLGPRVLTASILFALAFLGDETTVFFRLCLHVIERCAVRIQPLYFCMQFVVLALSLLLPSHLIVIFSTVFIDRFVTTMHNEIVGGDQRSVVRIQTVSPSPNDSDDARRPRWRRRSSLVGPERRARSVSMVSEVASEASGTGSSVKQGRMRALPPTPMYQARDMPRWGEGGTLRKTSFGAFSRPRRDVDDDDVWSRYLPVRRIRSFSVQNKPPSSILKHRPSPPPPSPLSSPSYQGTSPRLSLLGAPSKAEEPEDNIPADALSAATSLQSSPSANVCHGVLVQPSSVGTTHASSASPPLARSQRKALPSGLLTPSGTLDASTAPDGCIALSSHRPSASNVNTVSTPSPVAKCSKEEGHASPAAKFRPKASVKHGHGHGRQATSPHKSRHRQHALSANKRHPELAAPHTLDAKDEAPIESRRTSAQKIDAEPSPRLAVAARADSMPELATIPELVRPSRANQPQLETKQLEVRGVLKKRSQQYGPTAFKYGDGRSPERIAPSENGDLGVRAPAGVLTTAGSELPTSGRRSIQRTSMSDMKSPLERGSCSVATGAEQPALSVRVRALTTVARPAFIASAAYTAIFGNIASFNTLPVQKTVLVTLGCRDEQCPVNWLRWLAVSLPVAVACCAISWTCIYRNSLVNCDDSIDEQTHRDMSKCAYVRHKNMKRHTIREALLFYWLIGIPVASSAYATQHPGMFLEGPFLGLTLLVLSTAPGPAWRRCWSLRLLCWKNLCSRMPWDIILMLGSVMALSRTVEEYRLVEVGLAKLDDHFWAQRSAKASLFILVSVAAVLSEVVVGDSLARSMATTVVRVAVVTDTPVSFYVVPVSLVACINVMLPVSLPLLVMREYLEAKCAQMLAYGVLLKCTAVVVIFISMNTVGLFVFQADQPPAAQAYVIRNATGANRTVTL